MRTACLVAALAASSAPAAPFSTGITGEILDIRGCGAVELPDGSTVVSMIVMSDVSFGDPWLAGLDGSGVVAWTLPLAESRLVRSSRDLEEGGHLLLLPDGRVVLAACGSPRATGLDTDVCVICVEPGEGVAWSTTIGLDEDLVYSVSGIALLPDDRIALAGNIGCGVFQPYTAVLADDGTLLDLTLVKDEEFYMQCMTATPEGETVICGSNWACGTGIVLVDREGDVRTIETGIDPAAEVLSICPYGDRGYAAAGHLDGSPAAWSLDAEGRVLHSFEWPGEGRFDCMGVRPDGSVLLGGCLTGESYAAIAARLSPGWTVAWSREFAGDEWRTFDDVTPVGDEVILSGHLMPGGGDEGRTAAWFLRIGADGHLPPVTDNPSRPAVICDVIRPHMGWLIACGAFDSEDAARDMAGRVHDVMGLDTGAIWIPDWPSLSGARSWLAWARPAWQDGEVWIEDREAFDALVPDAYLVWVGNLQERRTESID
jgi:hypothetical protein